MIVLDALEVALRALGMRLGAIASNIANAETPGYRRRDVAFEAALERALRDGERMPDPVLYVDPTIRGPKGTGVDLVQEMAALARTQLRYDVVTRAASAYLSMLRLAAGGRG